MKADPREIAAAVERVRERIARAAERSSRRADEIRLVAVTKMFGADAVRAAYDAGVRHFGENRVQEWAGKNAVVGGLPDAVWHMIGHLQKNKARKVVELFHRVDSLDSLELAQKLEQLAAGAGRVLPVLIELRLAPEEAKTGIAPEGLERLAQDVEEMAHLKLDGLMTVPPWSEDPEPARPYFRQLRQLQARLGDVLGRALPVQSMGMSHDFEVAIEEGATEIRVGTAIFGRRKKAGTGDE